MAGRKTPPDQCRFCRAWLEKGARAGICRRCWALSPAEPVPTVAQAYYCHRVLRNGQPCGHRLTARGTRFLLCSRNDIDGLTGKLGCGADWLATTITERADAAQKEKTV